MNKISKKEDFKANIQTLSNDYMKFDPESIQLKK